MIGTALALLGVNVASEGHVQVILRNLGKTELDIGAGVLRVTVAKFATMKTNDDPDGHPAVETRS
jgi:hypothetical protein